VGTGAPPADVGAMLERKGGADPMAGSEAGAWSAAFEQASKMLGHRVELAHKNFGKTVHYWVVCDCGYESGHGRSFRFAMSAGVGHMGRVAKALQPAQRPRRDTPTVVEVPQTVIGQN
jgi:hypothetical protein